MASRLNERGYAMDSILTSIKLLLGITEDYEAFDQQLIMHINSVFMVLTQLGVGPTEGFMIENKNDTWDDFISDDSNLQTVKSYMYLKVKMLFDPPSSSAAMDSANRIINEFEWRLNSQAESKL